MFHSFRLLNLNRSSLIFKSSQYVLQVCSSKVPVPLITSLNYSSFKSSIALENLYPTSSLNISKTPSIPESGEKKFSGFIPMDKVKITYSRSSGPGGMNVNCVNTKVDIRFNLDSAEWIPSLIRDNMKTKLRTAISKDGFLIVVSDRTRSQHFNTADALEKLRELIRSCEPIENPEPTPDTLEKLRRRREKAARERLREKRERNNIKSSRGPSGADMI